MVHKYFALNQYIATTVVKRIIEMAVPLITTKFLELLSHTQTENRSFLYAQNLLSSPMGAQKMTVKEML